MKTFCSHCHLPFTSLMASTCSCCFGCFFLEGLSKKKGKKIFLLRWGLGVLFYLAVLAISYQTSSLDFEMQIQRWLAFGLTTGILVMLGFPLLKYSFTSLGQGSIAGAEGLMMVAILLDYGYSTYLTFSGLFVAQDEHYIYRSFLLTGLLLFSTYLVGYLEAANRKRSYEDIDKILSNQPNKAVRLVKNQEVETPINNLMPEDILRINPGEIIPCDGEVISGTTTVDESQLVGEKTLLLKQKGAMVTGGSLNKDATLFVKILRPLENHFLEQFNQRIRHILASPPGIELWFKKGFHDLLLVICLLAVITFSYQRFFHSETALFSALAVLIFMGLSPLGRFVPMITAMGLGRASRQGILIHSSELFEKLAKINALFFDKTGTLTTGRFQFSQLFLEKGVNQGTFLAILFSLEAQSTHPLANGVTTHPWYMEIARHPVQDLKVHPGLGLQGLYCERGKSPLAAAVGNQRFFKRLQIQLSRAMREKLEDLESTGETVILCGWGGQVCGLVSFADTLRSDVKPLLERLKTMDIDAVMITGDHDGMIAHLNYANGLKEIYARCLPDEKAKKIKSCQGKKQIVGMVSHFVNMADDLAMQQADLGILIGTGTHPLAVGSTSGITVLGQKLLKLADLIHYSRWVYGTIKFGVLLGLLYTATGLALSTLGLLTPQAALFAMVVWAVVFNTFPLRLIEFKFNEDAQKA